MVRAVDAVDRFQGPIQRALYDLADARSADQLCELARCYAEAADETFRKRLYEIVEQKPIAGNRCLGEAEIIVLDGESAFLFASRHAESSYQIENGNGMTASLLVSQSSDGVKSG